MLFRLYSLFTAFASIVILALPIAVQASPPEGRFIVVVDEKAGPPAHVAQKLARAHGGQVGYIYHSALAGFSITLPLNAVNAIQKRPDIALIEPDLPMSIIGQDLPTGISRSFAATNTKLDIDDTDDFRVDVDVAVLDTGIDAEHPDLNVVGGANCLQTSGGGPPWARSYYCDPAVSADDDHYHGTHVAGSIAALDNNFGVVGVAPGARLWALKVLDSSGSGYTSGIVAGIDWVVGQGNIEVLNMSLGGSGISQAYEAAIDNAVASGVVVVVAAGNSNADANNYSPAFVSSAITVSALADFDGTAGGLGSPTCRADQDDTLADFSNWGSAIDISAPGVCILSTYPIEKGEYASISGTSMAAPHVAGAAALLASGANAPSNGADVATIRDTLVNKGNFNWSDDSGDGVTEPLLDLHDSTVFSPTLVAGNGNNATENQSPIARFTYSCTDLSCNFDASTSTDSDGNIASYNWSFGDGNTSQALAPSHSYAADGTYTVALTVTDNEQASDTTSENLAVSEAVSGDITLSAYGYKVKGLKKVDLTWGEATSTQVDIFRNGALLVNTANDGSYTDPIDQRGGGSYWYQICEEADQGTPPCSALVEVVF